MAGTTEVKIAVALRDRLQSLSLNPSLPIAWQNVAFKPPADGKYLRVQHIPNMVVRQEITSDGPHRYLGLYQVSVHWPHDRGEFEPREIAAAIVAHFPTDLRLIEGGVEVRITKRPEAGDLLVEKRGVQVPVTIEYESYT